MKLTSEQLLQIEEYAGLFLTVDEIAALLDIEVPAFRSEANDIKSPVFRAILRGQTKNKMEIRKNVFKMAKHGSPQAEILAQKIIKDHEIETELDG